MKRVVLVTILAITFAVPVAIAQNNRDHIELGAFADYFRLSNANTHLWGLGGRVGVGLAPHVNLEADMAYDFERNFTAVGTGTNNSGIVTSFSLVNGVRLWHGLFGPMVWLGSKHARVFGEVKGGFINFSVSGAGVITGFTNVTGTFFTDQTKGAFYPGGGAELSLGPLGLRVDVGDFMYFNNGTFHNLSVKAGPTFHF